MPVLLRRAWAVPAAWHSLAPWQACSGLWELLCRKTPSEINFQSEGDQGIFLQKTAPQHYSRVGVLVFDVGLYKERLKLRPTLQPGMIKLLMQKAILTNVGIDLHPRDLTPSPLRMGERPEEGTVDSFHQGGPCSVF